MQKPKLASNPLPCSEKQVSIVNGVTAPLTLLWPSLKPPTLETLEMINLKRLRLRVQSHQHITPRTPSQLTTLIKSIGRRRISITAARCKLEENLAPVCQPPVSICKRLICGITDDTTCKAVCLIPFPEPYIWRTIQQLVQDGTIDCQDRTSRELYNSQSTQQVGQQLINSLSTALFRAIDIGRNWLLNKTVRSQDIQVK